MFFVFKLCVIFSNIVLWLYLKWWNSLLNFIVCMFFGIGKLNWVLLWSVDNNFFCIWFEFGFCIECIKILVDLVLLYLILW